MKSKFRSALALVLSLATVMCYSAPVGFAADTDTGQDTLPSAEQSVYLLTDYQQSGDGPGTVIKEFYVTADHSSVVGGDGTAINLEAKIDADNYSGDVTWKSDNPSVATISGTGKNVTAAMGQVTKVTDVTITATLADGSTASTVIEVKPVLVTSVKISGQNAEKYLVKNDRTRGSEQLTVNVEPKNAVDRTVIWTSSDESVLTVDNNGKVTATGQGTATVRAMNEASGVYDEVTYAVYSETPIESRNIKKAQQGFLGGFSADRRTSSEINSWVTNQYQDNCDQNFRLPADETPVKADSIVQKSFMNPNIYYINTVRIGSFIPGKQADWDTMKDAPKATYFRTHKLGNYYVIQYRTDNNPDSTTGWKYLKSDEYICAAYNIIRNEITDDDSLYKGTKITIGDWPFEGNQTSKKIIEIKLIDAEQNKVVYNSGPMYYSEGNPTEYFGRIIFNCDTSRYEIDHVTVSNYNNKDSKTIKLGDSIKDRAKYTDEGISVYFKSGRADHYTVTGYVTSKEFDVTYDPDNGEYPQTEKVKAVTDGKITELTVSDQIPTKDDHIFTGWLYGGKTYHEGDKLEMPPEDVTFTASWIPKSKVITYKSSDTGMGTVTRSYERLKDGQEAVGSTAVPNQGYTFLGWYDGDKKVSDDATFKPTEVGSYTAKFGYQQLAIKSNDGTWTYDGYEHSAPGANITYGGKTINATEIGSSTLEGTLNPGQTALVLSNFATITDPGQKDNTYDWKVVRKGKDGTLTNLTNKFKDNTSTEYGTLTVNPIVTFDANGGSFGSEKTVQKSVEYNTVTDASGVADPARGHYTFDKKWYDDKDCKTEHDFTKPVTEPITVYAGWTADKITVTFDANGGSFGSEKTVQKSVEYNTVTDASGVDYPAREHYTFDKKWYDDKDCKTEHDFTKPVTEPITVYAGWTADKITVTFDANGGSFGSEKTVQKSVEYNTVTDASGVADPARGHYTFDKKWYDDKDCKTEHDFTKPVTEPITVYAGWTADKITVTFDANGGSFGSEKTVQKSVEYNTVTDASGVADPARGHYTFDKKWYDDKDCKTEHDFTKPVTEPITVYAGWTADKITVTFDANGGSFGSEKTVQKSVEYNTVTDASGVADPARGHYTFDKKWYDDKDCKTEHDFTKPVTEPITVYAGWTADKITVTFDANGGSFGSEKTVQKSVEYNTVTDASGVADPARGHYTFDKKWYDDKDCKTEHDFTKPVTEPITVYAGWTKNSTPNPPTPITKKYTLTYVTNGGNEIAPEKYNEGVTVKLNKEPTRRGFSFTGWYSDPDLKNAVTSVIMDKDKKVYAGWKSSVPEILDSNNHEAYVAGYEDGSVKPMNNITREETAAIIFRLLDGKVRNDNLVDTNGFDDVLSSRWSNVEISTLESMQIIRGRSAEEFDPSAPITRAEFASMFARMSTVTASELNIKADKFSDIDGHWAAADINKAVALGWISGYPDGTFHPDAYITRAEAMTLINSVLQRAPASADELLTGVTWTDNTDPSAWYYISVQEATNSHEYDRSELVAPDEKWTKIKPTPDWDALRHKVRDDETENGAQTDQAAENNGTAGN